MKERKEERMDRQMNGGASEEKEGRKEGGKGQREGGNKRRKEEGKVRRMSELRDE